MLRTQFLAAMAGALWLAAFAQSQAPLKFEVATLKPSQPDTSGVSGIRPAPGGQRYLGSNASLRLFILVAYGVKGDQITGGPDWMDTARFDMNGLAAKQSSTDELHIMLRELLKERFHLQFHRETRQLPVYALTVDKDGLKLQARPPANPGETWIDQTAERMLQMKLKATAVTMDYFVFRLSQLMDRPVINQTSLPGSFDFELKYTRDPPPGVSPNALLNGEPIDTSGPTIFEAMRKQLRLKLEAQKGPVQIIVVDHAEKPTEN